MGGIVTVRIGCALGGCSAPCTPMSPSRGAEQRARCLLVRELVRTIAEAGPRRVVGGTAARRASPIATDAP